ncbi:DUF1000-domain-containing protein [Cylindrobasidium torrendii FP15055 ss-10]|uniref:DUF1000-domain-containing protein n=1 Tax=Cylindrobasidium torrendii FP15055 ss-10 TaxID=1314674 RepID=A0A0D7AYV3_9AGAR|nr:DUF1000-domain-containing protein [Cylindrobasidium torrendii FP15055 ss-10]
MAHEHNDHCGHEAHDHDHDHDAPGNLGPSDTLYPYIDFENVVALNAETEGRVAIKPWHERQSEEKFIESDADDQLILRVPFTGSVKLRAILLKTGPGEQTPDKVCIFANEDNLDFSDVSERKPIQEFDVPESRDVGEYAVKPAKFSNVTSVTLFFPGSLGGDTTRLYYVGFLGHWTERKTNPVITVYESQANLADHEKIQGMDGSFSAPQM